MKARITFFLLISAIACNSYADQLVYLSCDLPAYDGKPASHFDFTLDEKNSTITYYVKEANATNKEMAVFGPDKIT